MEGKPFPNFQRCGARTSDGPCQRLPINDTGRCRLHGGASTGPKTPEGRKRISEAQTARWEQIAVALSAFDAVGGDAR